MLPEPAQPLAFPASFQSTLRTFVAAYWQVLVLGGLVVLAAAARIVDVTGTPKGFFTDEASFGLNADLILRTGRDEYGEFLPVLFRSFGEYKLPVFIYAEVPFVAVFGRTEEAVRLTAAVLGSLTIVTTYLLAKELFRNEAGSLGAAAFLAIMPWHIHYSRTGLGDIVALPLFFALGFYLFFRAVRDQRFLLPAAIALALCFYCYRGGWAVLPPLISLMIVAYRRELMAYPRALLGAAAGVFALLLLPLVIHLVAGDSDRTSQAWIFNLEDERSTLGIFIDHYRSYFTKSFLFDNGDNNQFLRHYLPGQGVLLAVQAPLILAAVLAMAANFSRRHLFLLALLLLYPLTASISDTSPISSRAILGSVAFALLSGLGLQAILGFISEKRQFMERQWAIGSTLAVVVVLAAVGFVSYTAKYHDEYARVSDGFWGWQDGPQAIIERFEAVEDRYDEMFMDRHFNAPFIFFRFYAGDDGCSRCRIGTDTDYDPKKRQLFALKPEKLAQSDLSYRVIDTLFYKDGTIAFVFVEFGEVAARQPQIDASR